MRYTKIGQYHDPDGHISGASDPKEEYEIYLKFHEDNNDEVECQDIEQCDCENPCGFTLKDFERYIDDLKSDEHPKFIGCEIPEEYVL